MSLNQDIKHRGPPCNEAPKCIIILRNTGSSRFPAEVSTCPSYIKTQGHWFHILSFQPWLSQKAHGILLPDWHNLCFQKQVSVSLHLMINIKDRRWGFWSSLLNSFSLVIAAIRDTIVNWAPHTEKSPLILKF